MSEKCRTCSEEIEKTPGGHWRHVSVVDQILGKYPIHPPQPLVKMVEGDIGVTIYRDV